MIMTSPHSDWCAGPPACGLGEHRARPVTVRLPGRGSLVLTRVRTRTGREHAEVRMSIALPPEEPAAREHLARVLHDLVLQLRRLNGTRFAA